jgi:hypothetical protein
MRDEGETSLSLESRSNLAATYGHDGETSNVLGVTAPPRNDSDKLLRASSKSGRPRIPLPGDSTWVAPHGG